MVLGSSGVFVLFVACFSVEAFCYTSQVSPVGMLYGVSRIDYKLICGELIGFYCFMIRRGVSNRRCGVRVSPING